jgi:hypothetical protein
VWQRPPKSLHRAPDSATRRLSPCTGFSEPDLKSLPNRACQSQLPATPSCDFSKQAALLISLLRLRAAFAISTVGTCILQAGSLRYSRSALWLSHALHQVRKQGCPSSPALSSPKGCSRQEIADIPGFAARSGDAHRARGSLIFVPPQHADWRLSPSSVQQLRRRS